MKGKQYEGGKQPPLVRRSDVVLMQLLHPDLSAERSTQHIKTSLSIKADQVREDGYFKATV